MNKTYLLIFSSETVEWAKDRWLLEIARWPNGQSLLTQDTTSLLPHAPVLMENQ